MRGDALRKVGGKSLARAVTYAPSGRGTRLRRPPNNVNYRDDRERGYHPGKYMRVCRDRSANKYVDRLSRARCLRGGLWRTRQVCEIRGRARLVRSGRLDEINNGGRERGGYYTASRMNNLHSNLNKFARRRRRQCSRRRRLEDRKRVISTLEGCLRSRAPRAS